MARQVLENGVILPAEYSDDWYDDMTSNLTKLDDVIGSDSEKLSSADVGAAALSNSYNDLDNLPTIPTKTSDLTNDSNFVDTSNSAVASGITSAKVTSYDSHIADTDIHVTTADKSKWNNGVTQAYVFRYSSTALVASSTNSNTLLDNTDNLKVGDKVIDSNGVLFSITAIDTQNSTFTIGTALIDLAKDSDVVHKSGDETISGVKTITNTNLEFKSTSAEYGVSAGDSSVIFRDKNNLQTFKVYSRVFYSGVDNNLVSFFITQKVDNTYYNGNGIQLLANTGDKNVILRPIPVNNNADGLSVSLGASDRRWQSVYANNYYYGSDNVEFSTKFVTTDTNQTISGNKSFSNDLIVANTDTTANTPNLILRNYKADRGTTETAVQTIMFSDKNAKALTLIESRRISNGNTNTNILCYNTDNSNNTVSGGVAIIKSKTDTNFAPNADNAVTCGRALAKWSDVQTYKVNALEPSSLSLPSDRSARIDISSYFIYSGNNATNNYSVLTNGYIFLKLDNINQITCYSTDSSSITNYAQTYTRPNDGVLYITFPVRKNDNFRTIWNTGSSVSVEGAYFFPCQGNV